MPKAKKAGSDRMHFWCPGCDQAHGVTYAFPAPYGPDWSWNGDVHQPTIEPSILVTGGSDSVVCHSYVREGKIEFLGDCTHQLAGQTVDLPDWPYD